MAEEISISVYGKSALTISVEYQGDCWDIIKDFAIHPGRNTAGDHYCTSCLPGYVKYYRTRQELLVKHSFEPLLKWCNAHMRSDYWVLLFRTSGATWAKLVREEDMESTRENEGREHFVRAFPVIN